MLYAPRIMLFPPRMKFSPRIMLYSPRIIKFSPRIMLYAPRIIKFAPRIMLFQARMKFSPRIMLYAPRIMMFPPRIMKFSPRIMLYAPRIMMFPPRIMMFPPRIMMFPPRIMLYAPRIPLRPPSQRFIYSHKAVEAFHTKDLLFQSVSSVQECDIFKLRECLFIEILEMFDIESFATINITLDNENPLVKNLRKRCKPSTCLEDIYIFSITVCEKQLHKDLSKAILSSKTTSNS